jgi:transposase
MLSTKLQKQNDFTGQDFFVGLDVHKSSWYVTIRSLKIEVGHFTQAPDAAALHQYLKRNFPGGRYHSAYEAGFCGTGAHEQLCKLGIDNIIVHAADVPTTDKQKKSKTDLRDSRAIADHLERGNLHGIYVLSQEQQELRSLFRLRECRSKDTTRANNRLKSFLMYYGITIPESVSKRGDLTGRALAWLDIELRSAAGTITLGQYVSELKYQRRQLFELTKTLRQQVMAYDGQTYMNIITIPGVGSITAMAFVAEIGDFGRFADPDQYASLLGLCPWEDTSGDCIVTKGIQPRCNRHLRPLIIEASWHSIRKSRNLFAYYSKHAVGKNGKKAIVKVARKLAMIIRGVARSGQPYQEDYQMKNNNPAPVKKVKAERFSSGITKQHINKKPDYGQMPMPG